MIDWTRVTALRDEIGADDFEEVVELFVEEVDALVARLRRDGKTHALEEDMHFLKGSALNLGFATLSELCEAGEYAAARGAGADVDLDAVLESYDASRAEFLRDLAMKLAA